MDFYRICTREIEKGPNKGLMEVYPDWKVGRSTDLMVKGRQFYAIWDPEVGLWSRDEYDVVRIVDKELHEHAQRQADATGIPHIVRDLLSFNSQSWKQFRQFLQNISDNSHDLDDDLTFANTEVKKSDYVSHRLPYALEPGDYSAWDELLGTLYSVEQREKIEWAIGSIIAGDAKKLHKFLVFYGPPGSGKSTVLNVIENLFYGYTTTFDAKALGGNSNAFATEVFKDNPLVAIQQDGDLSRIEDNAKLNSIISHDNMPMNEKYKPGYTSRVKAFLFMGTNQPVKISDAKSGIIRRLIDVHPTGVKIPTNHYFTLVARTDFELGAIAHHCLEVYRDLGKHYYAGYRPTEMMLQTDVFFNFIEANYDIFKAQDATSLKQAYQLYKEFCAETGIKDNGVLPQYKVREELRNYFDEFHNRGQFKGGEVRSLYLGFNANKFKVQTEDDNTFSLVLEETVSLLDEQLADMPAQYASSKGGPAKFWTDKERLINDKMQRPRPEQICNTVLSDLDTSKLHYTKVPQQRIVIDFDLKDEDGNKSLERNLQAASEWLPTYGELSQGGQGVHLHYDYIGDVSELQSVWADGIEIKTLLGDSSLRRRLSKCNNVPVATMNGGLPKKEKKVVTAEQIKSERSLRNMIGRCLKKEFHGHTKPEIDFIHHILEGAYKSDLQYDVTDMKSRILAFAVGSGNQADQCIATVKTMKFKSDHDAIMEEAGFKKPGDDTMSDVDPRIVFFDIEVYKNLFVVCWKYQGSDQVVRMINPSSQEIELLLKMKLVGFNCRRYDNHILYAALLGFTVEQLYNLSQKIINGERNSMFGEAYDLSYADIYEFSSVKKSLKRFEIDLGIKHIEMDHPWDQPVPDHLIEKIVEYCCNDVEATEKVFESRYQDFVARLILADLSGLKVNDTTQRHTARIIFGTDRRPQEKFKYTRLATEFPGYTHEWGKSTYRGMNPSEGGFVYEEIGAYENVVVLDVASMHPTSIRQLEAFGPYTPNFNALLDARVAIKRKDYDSAREMLGGKLAPYLENPKDAKELSYALKIVINIVYGMTSAKFDNPFKDPRNNDNFVAKRGALFMIDLLKYVQEVMQLQVVHIKTDSIKIPNATAEHIEEIKQFGDKYGYEFEHEATYDKFCLVDKAQYIARYGWHATEPEKVGTWEATGALFQHPYIYKNLFSHEEVTFNDLCETKQVIKGSMYLDFEEDRPEALGKGMQFIGRSGRFVPVVERGGHLYRVQDDNGELKKFAVTGTKGYLWLEAEMAQALLDELEIDMNYFDHLLDKAHKAVDKHIDFDSFVS